MPPRISFSRDEIIKAGLDLIREGGAGRFTARAIAEKMGGSTQPLYREFSTIESLEEAVVKSAEEIATRHMIEYSFGDEHFLSIGLGFLEFAIRQPELYRLLFLSGKKRFQFDHTAPPYDRIFAKMKMDTALAGMSDEVLVKLFRDMAIYSHGLCSAGLLRPGGFTVEEYLPFLMDMGKRLIIYEILRAEGVIDEEAIQRRIHHEHHHS
jgi:AcrR family transcriptional regulator